jgi:hypothetical protein
MQKQKLSERIFSEYEHMHNEDVKYVQQALQFMFMRRLNKLNEN